MTRKRTRGRPGRRPHGDGDAPGEPFGRVRVGTSGYDYKHWRGRFYPEELPEREWLTFYASRFDTVEINATFYRLPGPEVFDHWRELAPLDFLFALKFSRYGSHLKHLKDAEGTVGRFVEVADRLGGALGPILVQLPPRWKVDLTRLREFLDAAGPGHRWAVEFREPSWLCSEVFDILRDHGAALCIHDLLPDHPVVATASWAYIRFHGHVPGGRYGSRRLMLAVQVIERFLGEGLDVYAYFNNDAEAHAVRDALELKRLLGDLRSPGPPARDT